MLPPKRQNLFPPFATTFGGDPAECSKHLGRARGMLSLMCRSVPPAKSRTETTADGVEIRVTTNPNHIYIAGGKAYICANVLLTGKTEDLRDRRVYNKKYDAATQTFPFITNRTIIGSVPNIWFGYDKKIVKWNTPLHNFIGATAASIVYKGVFIAGFDSLQGLSILCCKIIGNKLTTVEGQLISGVYSIWIREFTLVESNVDNEFKIIATFVKSHKILEGSFLSDYGSFLSDGGSFSRDGKYIIAGITEPSSKGPSSKGVCKVSFVDDDYSNPIFENIITFPSNEGLFINTMLGYMGWYEDSIDMATIVFDTEMNTSVSLYEYNKKNNSFDKYDEILGEPKYYKCLLYANKKLGIIVTLKFKQTNTPTHPYFPEPQSTKLIVTVNRNGEETTVLEHDEDYLSVPAFIFGDAQYTYASCNGVYDGRNIGVLLSTTLLYKDVTAQPKFISWILMIDNSVKDSLVYTVEELFRRTTETAPLVTTDSIALTNI